MLSSIGACILAIVANMAYSEPGRNALDRLLFTLRHLDATIHGALYMAANAGFFANWLQDGGSLPKL